MSSSKTIKLSLKLRSNFLLVLKIKQSLISFMLYQKSKLIEKKSLMLVKKNFLIDKIRSKIKLTLLTILFTIETWLIFKSN